MNYQDKKLLDFLSNFYDFDNEFFSLAILDRKNKKFYSNVIKNIDKMNNFDRLILNTNYCNYFSLNTFKTNKKTEQQLKKVNCLFFDFDDGDLEKIEKIENDLGLATFKITTTKSKNKFQLIYLFDFPIFDNFDNIKIISKTLTYHFKSDKTFDLARIARLPFSINSKTSELVELQNNNIKYSLKHFKDYITANKIELEELDNITTKTTKNIVKTTKNDINKESSYYDLYNKFEIKTNNDKSEARYKFICSLRSKKVSKQNIKKICIDLNFDILDIERILLKVK
jgi:hypothetical protein